MKSHHFLFCSFLLCCLLAAFYSNAQVQLEPRDCNSLRASFSWPKNTKASTPLSGSYTFLLEKEVIPKLWQKILTKQTTRKEVVFSHLPKAAYRVSIIPQPLPSPTFHSNTAILGQNNCDEYLSTEEQHSFKIAQKQLVVYPIPAHDKLYIQWPKFIPLSKLSVYHLTGKQLLQIPIDSDRAEIDVSGLPSGVYLLTIEESSGLLLTRKFSIIQ